MSLASYWCGPWNYKPIMGRACSVDNGLGFPSPSYLKANHLISDVMCHLSLHYPILVRQSKSKSTKEKGKSKASFISFIQFHQAKVSSSTLNMEMTLLIMFNCLINLCLINLLFFLQKE